MSSKLPTLVRFAHAKKTAYFLCVLRMSRNCLHFFALSHIKQTAYIFAFAHVKHIAYNFPLSQ